MQFNAHTGLKRGSSCDNVGNFFCSWKTGWVQEGYSAGGYTVDILHGITLLFAIIIGEM